MNAQKSAFRACFAISSLSCLSLFLASCGPDPIPVPEGSFVNDRVPEATPGGIPSAAALPPPLEEPSVAPVQTVQTVLIPATPQPQEQLPPPAPKTLPQGAVEYRVQKNDSMWKIASVYGVTVKRLAEFNNMEPSAILQPGDILLIPAGGRHSEFTPTIQDPDRKPPKIAPKPERKLPAPAPQAAADGKMRVHVVKKGETLGGIAYRNHLRVSELARANGLSVTAMLKIGQRLNIPEPTTKPDKKPADKQTPPKKDKPATAPKKDKPATAPKKDDRTPVQPAAEPSAPSKQSQPAAPAQPAPPAPAATESPAPSQAATPPAAETVVIDTVLEESLPPAEPADELPSSVPVSLDMEMTLEEIAVEYDRDLPTIQRLNPGIDPKKKLPARTQVKIPVAF